MKALNGPNPWWHRRFSSGVNKLKKLSFDLLSGAWFHKKNIGDTEVIDETPDVDTSRPTHKARALQFTGAEHIDIPYQLDLTQRYKFTYEFICTEHNNWETIIDSRVQSIDRSFSTYIRPDRTVTVNTQYGQLNFDPVITGCRYLVTIEHNGSEITATLKNTTLDTSQTLSNSTLAYTPDTAETFFRIGAAPYSTSNLRQRLGYFKYEEDGITLIEYAFEEGEGTTCYNRVMNNFHGTINNATISTFRVEDVRITNGDQGTFLNTDGYSPLNVYTSDFSINDGWTLREDAGLLEINNGVLAFQGTSTDFIYAYKELLQVGTSYIVTFRIRKTVNGVGPIKVWLGLNQITIPEPTTEWQTVTVSGICTSITALYFIFNETSIGGEIDDLVVTQPNVYVPRPRVTDIPLYNAGKYAYYIPDHANNFIDLNTAFAGLTNDGDWMEFGIATVGTGEPDSETGSWATHTSGGSQFFANIASGVDFRFFGPNGGQNQMRTVVASIDIPNNDFYLLKVTKTVEAPAGTSGTVGQLDLFDRDGNLIVSHNLSAGTLGNEGTYTFDRFFPQTYSTDFILAYLKLSDGTVWNGANDFNGGVNITNTGTGNVTKIFFESVDEDVLGNPLTYKGQVAQPLSLVNSNGIRFSDQEQIELTNDLTVSDFTEIAYVYFDSTLASATDMRALFFYDTGSSSDGWVTIENNELRYGNSVSGGQSPYSYTTTIPNFLDTWQKVGISRTGSEIVIVVGDEVRTVDISAVAAGTNTFEAIGRFGNNPKGDLAWISFHSKGMTAEEIKAIDPYNMDTDSLEVFYAPSVGSGSTIYDVSGNNNHGTIVNATLSDFWIKQDQFHWNLKKGFLKGFGTSNNAYYNLDQPLEDPIGKTVKFGFVHNTGSGRQWLFTTNVSGVGSFYVQHNTNNNIQIEQQGVNSVILISGSNFTDGHYYEVEFNYPATSDLQTVSTVLLNGTSASFTTSGSIYGSSGNHIGHNSSGSFPLTDTRIVFIKIGDTLYSELNNWGGATLVNSSSAEYLRVPDLATENVAFAAGKWHNDAETEINFPHTAKLQVINEQFDYKPFFYKNAQLDDATAAYSMRKVIADYEGPLLNVIRSSDLQEQDFYPDSRGDLDTAAITSFVNDSTPVLDDYTGAAAAYSLRKVKSAYTGSAIEVRRSSNGDTLDIGFDNNGNLDTTALLSFVNASGNAYTSDFRVIGDPPVDQEDMGETGGTGAGGQSIADVSDAYKFTQDGSTGIHRAGTPTNTNIVGGNVSVSFDYYLPSGQTSDRILFRTSDAGDTQVDLTTTDDWTTYSTTFIGISGSEFWFYSAIIGQGLSFAGNGSDHFYLKNIVVTQTDADGAVTTWYDQSGNDNRATADCSNPSACEQPLIVEAGDVVLENNKPAIKFDGVDDYFTGGAKTTMDNTAIFAVIKSDSNTQDAVFIQNTVDANNCVALGLGNLGTSNAIGSRLRVAGVNVDSVGDSTFTATDQTLVSYLADNTAGQMFVDGTEETDAVDSRSGGSNTTIGARGDGNTFFNGAIQEVIFFDSDQSGNRTGIEANIGRYYTIDGFADGRVATWYDQANANHATQATPDEQPLIVNDGVLVTENSKPAIDFDGVDDYLATPSIAHGTNDISIIGVFVNELTTGDQSFVSSQHASGMQWSRIRNDEFFPFLNDGTSSFQITNSSFTANQQYLYSSIYEADWEVFANGTSLGTDTIGAHADIGSGIYAIGALYNNTDFLQGKVQELTLFNSDQSSNRQDIEKNIADYYDITLSGNAGVESWVKNVSFADMYQSWFDYEYLHRLFANFEIPNKVFKVLAYTSELTADQRQQVYDYLQKNYHPIYTPYSTRVLADGGTLAAGQTNTLTIIDSI